VPRWIQQDAAPARRQRVGDERPRRRARHLGWVGQGPEPSDRLSSFENQLTSGSMESLGVNGDRVAFHQRRPGIGPLDPARPERCPRRGEAHDAIGEAEPRGLTVVADDRIGVPGPEDPSRPWFPQERDRRRRPGSQV
jgi:hypothetical protein